jgi:hypothetical protein
MIKLYEDNAGTLLFVDGDLAVDVTAVQFDSCFRADVKSWNQDFWGVDDPGRAVYHREEGTVFRDRDDDRVTVDLSNWTHIATYEDGTVTRHNDGGLAAGNYMDEESVDENVEEWL